MFRAAGRAGHLAHPGGAGRAHDQAHGRAGLSHRAAPEGLEPGADGCSSAGPGAAGHVQRAAAVQRLRVARRRGLGPLGHGARAGEAVQLRNRPEAGVMGE